MPRIALAQRFSYKTEKAEKTDHGVLKVHVHKARDLAAKDKNNTSDPFLVLTFGDQKNSTVPIPKNLNPEWNETIEFALGSLVLEVVCWDKDRFSNDYMGEFDISLPEVYGNKEPVWYKLESRRQKTAVTGEVQISLEFDNVSAHFEQKLAEVDDVTGTDSESDVSLDEPERKRRLRIRRLKTKAKAYELTKQSDLAGVVFVEINKITDLPPERNVTRTSFDMDPFVVTSLGKKTYKTKVIRHNLNPVYDEKLLFHILRHEQQYSLQFAVIDRDKLSGNDFIGTVMLPLDSITSLTPEASSGLYRLKDPEPFVDGKKPRFRLPLSRSSSSTNIKEKDDLHYFPLPLQLKNQERWEDKHKPVLHVRAKFMPYPALRQQFWRALIKQYDTDDNGCLNRVEFTTMLDSIGSTLHESTINGIFERFGDDDTMTHDAVVLGLEDLLQMIGKTDLPKAEGKSDDELSEDHEEHIVEIRECPICRQPRMKKKSDADIITHMATCASQDWRQVNNIVMGGFVTSSQAQRKWYSKVVTKISYGGYKLGANSANILVQDRITGQINEERMSVYVRLGIRLLYKGLKSRDMEKKRIRKLLRSMSLKQGRKFDDPTSSAEIQSFINFHRLDMSEVLLPTHEFANFNEFFYRALKPDARPCSAPDRPEIITSPADCRTVVFNTLEEAQKIWVKGREFTVERLLGKAYPQDVQRYQNGSLGIFRLAPQDYHRFHIPVDGIMDEPKLIDGEYYTVNPMAIRSALDVYGENIRVVVPIDSTTHGRVMVICVGAMMVGSTVITRKAGEKVARAEELGYFKFGGSTILLLFEPGQMVFDDDLVENSAGALETLVSLFATNQIRVGMSVGHSQGKSAHTPDMRKPPANVSKEEKQEAARKIEGSIDP